MHTTPGDERTALTTIVVLATVLVVTAVPLHAAVAAADVGTARSITDVSDSTGVGDRSVAVGGELAVHASTQEAAEQVTLVDDVLTEQRGDVVEMTFNFSGGAREADVTLGDAETVGFEVEFTVRDGDGDGTVVVLWNTARSAVAPAVGLSVVNGDAGPGGDALVGSPTVVEGVDRPVEPAGYPISVVAAATGVETDLGRVDVQPRSSENLTVHTAPASRPGFETASQTRAAVSTAAAGRTIAVGEYAQDWVVLRLAASGLSGYLDDVDDFEEGTNGVTLTVAQDDATVEPNGQPVGLQLSGNATLLADPETDVYYVVFRASELLDAGATVGDRFTANLTVGAANNVTPTTETLTANFTLVEGQGTFDQQDGQLVVDANETARLAGTSTWAPGTVLLVHLRSSDTSGGGTPFTVEREVVVQADGTWNATVDLSNQTAGQNVTGTLFHTDTSVKLASTPGELR